LSAHVPPARLLPRALWQSEARCYRRADQAPGVYSMMEAAWRRRPERHVYLVLAVLLAHIAGANAASCADFASADSDGSYWCERAGGIPQRELPHPLAPAAAFCLQKKETCARAAQSDTTAGGGRGGALSRLVRLRRNGSIATMYGSLSSPSLRR